MQNRLNEQVVSSSVERMMGKILMGQNLVSEGKTMVSKEDMVEAVRSAISGMNLTTGDPKDSLPFEKTFTTLMSDLSTCREQLGMNARKVEGYRGIFYELEDVKKNAKRLMAFGIRTGRARDFAVKSFLDGEPKIVRLRESRSKKKSESESETVEAEAEVQTEVEAEVEVQPVASAPSQVSASVVKSEDKTPSIVSQIRQLWPQSEPYIGQLVDRAEKALGSKVVKKGNTRCCSPTDFRDIALGAIRKPDVHIASREATAKIVENVNGSVPVNMPKGVPVVTERSLDWLLETRLLPYASDIAQMNVEFQDEIERLTQQNDQLQKENESLRTTLSLLLNKAA